MASSTIKGITIQIGGDTTDLSKALTGINTTSKSLQTELRQVEKLLKMDGSNITLCKQKEELLTKAVEATKEKLDTLKTAEEQVQEQFENGEVSEEQYRALERQIAETEIQLNSYETQLEEVQKTNAEAAESTDEFADAADEAGEDVSGLGDEAGEAGEAAEEMGDAADTAADQTDDLGDAAEEAGENAEQSANGGWTVAKDILADLASSVIKECIDALKELAESVVETGSGFDTAMSQLAATMGTTTDSIQELEEFAKEMGSTTKYTAEEAAEGLNILAQSGLTAEEQMQALPDVLNLASAGAMDLDEAAGYVTTTIKGFGDTTENTQYYVDLMAKGATLANTDVSSLGAALSSASANTSAYGQSAETTTLELLKLAEGGMSGEEAATALSRAMADLYTPTDEASAALEALGVATYDADGNARDFEDIVQDLDGALEGYSEEQQNAYKDTIFTTNGLKAYNKIAGVSDEKTQDFKEGLESASEAMNGEGSAAEQAATQLDNFEGDMTLLGSATDGVKVKLWEMVEGPLRDLVQWVTNSVIPAINTMLDNLPVVATVIAGVTAAVIAFKVASLSAKLATEGLTIATEAQRIAQEALSAVMNASPIGIIILAITALVAAFMYLWNNCEAFREFWINLWENIKAAFQAVVDFLQPAIESIKQFFSDAWDKIQEVWEQVSPYFQAIWDAIQLIFSVVAEVLGGFFDVAWTAIKTIWDAVTGYFQAIWDTIKGIFSVVQSILSGDFQGAWDAIKGIVNTWKSYFQGVWDGIKGVFSAVVSFFRDTFQNAWNAVKNAFSGFTSFFQNLWNSIKTTFSNLGTNIANAISGAVKSGINGVISMIQNTINSAIGLINGAIGLINKLPGVSVSKVSTLSLPRLAKGGEVEDGSAIVGEEGAELLNMVNGKAVITPLTSSSAKKNIAEVTGSKGNAFEQTINITSNKELSPSEVARQTRNATRNMIKAIKKAG